MGVLAMGVLASLFFLGEGVVVDAGAFLKNGPVGGQPLGQYQTSFEDEYLIRGTNIPRRISPGEYSPEIFPRNIPGEYSPDIFPRNSNKEIFPVNIRREFPGNILGKYSSLGNIPRGIFPENIPRGKFL